MYFPGIEEMAALREARRRNADEAARYEEQKRRYQERQTKQADVEDAQWREIPTNQLTAPDT